MSTLSTIAKFVGLPDRDNDWNLGNVTNRWKKLFLSEGIVSNKIQHVVGHRLTLLSGAPYNIFNSYGVNTLYFSPFLSNSIRLFNGNYWEIMELNEISFNIDSQNDMDSAAITSSSVYDVYINYNGGTPAINLKKWTDSVTRAVTPTRANGVLVHPSNTQLLLVGSISTDSATNLNHGLNNRGVDNIYNQKPFYFYNSSNASHSYTSGTERLWNNNGYSISFISSYPKQIKSISLSNTGNNNTVTLKRNTSVAVSGSEQIAYYNNYYGNTFNAMSGRNISGATSGLYYVFATQVGNASATFTTMDFAGAIDA